MPKTARAVANACGKNPYSPKVPCHRVIRSDGSIGGYSGPGGSKTKKKTIKKRRFFALESSNTNDFNSFSPISIIFCAFALELYLIL